MAVINYQQGRRGDPGTKGGQGPDGVKGERVSSAFRKAYFTDLKAFSVIGFDLMWGLMVKIV